MSVLYNKNQWGPVWFDHSSKYLSTEESLSCRVETTWGWLNDNRTFIFGRSIPLMIEINNTKHCNWTIMSLCISQGVRMKAKAVLRLWDQNAAWLVTIHKQEHRKTEKAKMYKTKNSMVIVCHVQPKSKTWTLLEQDSPLKEGRKLSSQISIYHIPKLSYVPIVLMNQQQNLHSAYRVSPVS